MSVSHFLAPGRFPAGTVLGVYKSPTGETLRPIAGATVATPTMTATGVTVTGLERDTQYVAGAVVEGRWLASAFRSSGDAGIDAGDIGANSGNVEGEVRLTTITGKATLRFGIDSTQDYSDLTGFMREAGGVLRTNAHIALESGLSAASLRFGYYGDESIVSLQAGGSGGESLYVQGKLQVTDAVGFNGVAPVAKPNVVGSRGGNAALASLLTALASYGLITNGSSA